MHNLNAKHLTCASRKVYNVVCAITLLYTFSCQDGSTPLMVHAESGNVAVVNLLLEAQAFINAQDKVEVFM